MVKSAEGGVVGEVLQGLGRVRCVGQGAGGWVCGLYQNRGGNFEILHIYG